MKNILYIHQYFKTPEDGGALRSYFIAKGLVERGFNVQMLTAHNKPILETRIVEGIFVWYVPVRYSNTMPFARRYLAFLRFALSSIQLYDQLQKPDLIYATSTPLTVGIIALWLRWRRKIPFIFEVRDLWPEAPIQLGILKNFLVRTLAVKLEKALYKNALENVALSPGIEAGIKKKVPGAKVIIVPNMADIHFFQEKQPHQETKRLFTIGYFGTMGLANDVEFIIKIARSCQEKNLAVEFLLAGDGAKKHFIEEIIENGGIKNIEILPNQNRYEVRGLMEKVDACLTTFLNLPVLETNSPNKFFDGLAAGKLSIVNTKGWLKDLVEKNACGIYIDTEKPETFPEKIEPFVGDKGLLKKYQENALSMGRNVFSREMLVARICDRIETLLA
jgi:glycosyltransferase involved in cell wall biosynthesis